MAKICKHGHTYETKRCSECWKRARANWWAKAAPEQNQKKVDWYKANPEYAVWQHMRDRCYDPKYVCYHRYGGRGITVCDRWQGEGGYANFLADMGRRPTAKHQIDRINNDGNYEPGNCKWSTPAEQAINRHSVRKLTLNGRTQCLSAWATELGIDRQTLTVRLDRLNWSFHKALTTPVRGTRGR